MPHRSQIGPAIGPCSLPRHAQAVGHLAKQSVRPCEFEDGAAGRDGVQEIGDRTQGVVDAFPILRLQRSGVPAVYLADDNEGVAQGVFRGMLLHSVGDDCDRTAAWSLRIG